MSKFKIYLVTFSFLIALLASCKQETKYYVSTQSDTHLQDGSEKYPFSSIDKAIDKILSDRSISGSKDEAMILVKGGEYYISESIELDSRHSNLTISAVPGDTVILSGAKSLDKSRIEPRNLNNAQVWYTNLNDHGITDYGVIHRIGFSHSSWGSPAELFIDNTAQQIARWPNEGMTKMGTVIRKGSIPRDGDHSGVGGILTYDSVRISGWNVTSDMWLSGYFHHGYADDRVRIKTIDSANKTIETVDPTFYGFVNKAAWNKWYALNVKEELDTIAEYFIDRSNGDLFFMAENKDFETIKLSMLESPFITMDRVEDVNIQNIIFEESRFIGITLAETANVRILGCTFRNLGAQGIAMGMGIAPHDRHVHNEMGKPQKNLIGSLQQHIYDDTTFDRRAGFNNGIIDCEFYNLGSGGISMGGGNRFTLEPGNNYIENCRIHDNNRLEKSYQPAIHITGVGNKIINCEIWNTPSMAVLMHGNNHLIESNHFHDVCLEADDQGAIYYGRNPSECGSLVRYNLFENIPGHYSTCGIYHDDGAGGLTVQENVFYKTGTFGVLMGGGSDNYYHNNIFVDVNVGIHVDNRLQNWSSALIVPHGLFEQRLNAVYYDLPPYSEQYPYLKNYIPNDGEPRNNRIYNNTFINVKDLSDDPKMLDLKNNLSISEDQVSARAVYEKMMSSIKEK